MQFQDSLETWNNSKSNSPKKICSLCRLWHRVFILTLFLCLPCLVSAGGTDYSDRASNFDGKIFYNEHEFILLEDIPKDAPVWALSDKEVIPENKLPLKTPDFTGDTTGGELFFTWFGHSSLLLQMDGKNILFENHYPTLIAWCLAHTAAGSICLLSPAAASYDSFKNFEHRGDTYKEEILRQSQTLNLQQLNSSQQQ